MAGKPRTYEGQDIGVTYDLKRCIHAKECVNRLSAVFDVDKRPWIQPDNASADDLAETILLCPTGALHYDRKDGGLEEQAPEENMIRLVIDGPLYIRGDVEVMNSNKETVVEDTRIALCRCGASEHKPFCDNSHIEAGFKDSATPDEKPDSDPNTSGDSKLHIDTAKNGPLLLRGEFEIVDAQGQSVHIGNKAALCRCGHSSNKPFCDGTHSNIDFEAD